MWISVLSDGEWTKTDSILLYGGFFLFIISMPLFGFLCMRISKKKGCDSPLAFFFLGFFLRIIGLIICLFMQDLSKQTPHDKSGQSPEPTTAPDEPEGIQCPECGMTNPLGASFCNCCGNKLD